jgi:hypothetical protein
MSGRDPPGARQWRFLGYACGSLWTVPAALYPVWHAVQVGDAPDVVPQ